MPDEPNLFILMVASVAQMAATYMGDVQNEAESESKPDLDAAKEAIDTLRMLREKTRGNLTKIEEDILVDAIFQLQRRYLDITSPDKK